jgi:hypothetical protein
MNEGSVYSILDNPTTNAILDTIAHTVSLSIRIGSKSSYLQSQWQKKLLNSQLSPQIQ